MEHQKRKTQGEKKKKEANEKYQYREKRIIKDDFSSPFPANTFYNNTYEVHAHRLENVI